MARGRSCKTIGGEDVGKLREKVGETLWGGEEISSKRRRRQRIRGKAQGRIAAENLLVGQVQEKIVMVEKVRPEDRNGDRSQLKKLLKTVGTKT